MTGKRLLGLVSFKEIKDTLSSGSLRELLLAADLMTPAKHTVPPEAPLSDALDLMKELRQDHLPVVEASARRKTGGLPRSAAGHACAHSRLDPTKRAKKGRGNQGGAVDKRSQAT